MAPQFQSFIMCQFKLQHQNHSSCTSFYYCQNMSLGKPRSFSSQKAPVSNASKQKRRYQRLHTDNPSNQMAESTHTSKHVERESFVKRNRPWSSQVTKDPETIMEENINLKVFINNLQQQLSLQRSRLEMNRRKNQKVVKQINREFQKQMYYSGKNPSGYLVSGVKHQYDNMKNMYEQKCLAIQSILKSIESTSIEELKVYIQALEGQNRVFRDQLQSYVDIGESFPSFNQAKDNNKKRKSNRGNSNIDRLYSQTSEDKSEASNVNLEVLASLLGEERNNVKIAKTLIESLNAKIQRLNGTNSELLKKVQFLQQLVIEKDNNEHEARRQFKRVEKQKLVLQQQIDRLNETLNTTENLYKLKFRSFEERQTKKFEIEREIFEKSLRQKNQTVQKLEKEIRFLSTMLSYWKPLDEINRQFQQQLEDQPQSPIGVRENTRSQKDDKNSISVKFRGNSQFNVRESHKSEASMLGLEYPGKLQTQYEHSIRGNRQDDFPIKRTITGNRSNSIQNAINVIKQKPRYNCQKKRSENAKKVRKVDINQIKQYGELLRYRLIGHNIDNQKIKQFFNPPSENILNPVQSSSEFITMKQITQILKNTPFCLKEQEAVIVSRYIVQDSNNEYVYWDENNEINRNIAKSILRAFIGEYKQPDLELNKEEWRKLKAIYLNNILTALKTIAPKGLVTLVKFNELLVGLGIETTDELRDWIIGEMVIKSNSLEELKYSVILEL